MYRRKVGRNCASITVVVLNLTKPEYCRFPIFTFLFILLYICSDRGRYNEGEVNIHYRSPVRYEEKEELPEEELRKRLENSNMSIKKFWF